MHLWWEPAPPPAPEVSAVLEIVEPPVVPHLYFWALQVSFVDRGRRVGGAHLGLQWYDRHPGSTAVNWGGYRDAGLRGPNATTGLRGPNATTGLRGAMTSGELDGEPSPLPSATGNPNTRDYPWRAGTPYRLRIRGDGDGWWVGEVTDLVAGTTTAVRRLRGGGTHLVAPVVWSEVFARCDDPTVTVRWSALDPTPASLRPTYQSHDQGGCANTASRPDPAGDGWLQETNVRRT